jgi:predicted dehydrogenase
VHRRDFLLAGAAASAAAAAERPIRAAVYGLGHAHAGGKVRTLRSMPGYDLAGVCEPEQPELLAKPEYAGLTRLDRDAMLDDKSIKLIAVEADVQYGLAYAHEAIDAGRHVHLDKPPGEDLESLRSLFDKAKSRGLAVQMGYMWRYHIAMSEALRLARTGLLGDVYAVRATIDKPISPEERKQLARFRGGMMFELGCHMIDRIVDLLGKPRKVTGRLRHDAPVDDELADNTLAILEYDKAIAEVYIAAMQPHGNNYRTFEIRGTRGTATVRPFAPDGGLYVDSAESEGERRVPLSIPRWRGPYEPDFTVLAGFIRKGESLGYTAEHDLAVQETLLRACGVL